VDDGSSTASQPLSITINITTPTAKLVGADDATVSLPLSAGNLSLTRFQATATGNAVTFKVKSDRSANVKVAIYADSSGEPGALLNAVNTGTSISAGWNDITIASTAITSGNYYWLAINSNTLINCATASPGGTIRYKSAPYAGFTFTNPAGTGFKSASGITALLAGWGATGP
jgi:hypothetical protein